MKIALLCPTLSDPVDCSPPGSSVHEILQARILEWVAVPFSRRSSRARDWTQVSCIAGVFFTVWAAREALVCLGKSPLTPSEARWEIDEQKKSDKTVATKLCCSCLCYIQANLPLLFQGFWTCMSYFSGYWSKSQRDKPLPTSSLWKWRFTSPPQKKSDYSSNWCYGKTSEITEK